MRRSNHSECERLGRIGAHPICQESEQLSPLPKSGGSSGNPRLDCERRQKKDLEKGSAGPESYWTGQGFKVHPRNGGLGKFVWAL